MLRESEQHFFEELLEQGIGSSVTIKALQHVSGGDINHATLVQTDNGNYFVKWNQFPESDLFEKEATGLKLLSKARAINVVKPISFGKVQGKHFLILESVEKGQHSRSFWENFGRSLSKMHQIAASHFGLDHSNYIGKLPQSNTPDPDWASFFINQRIIPQLEMARNKGIINRQIVGQFDLLFPKLEQIFPRTKPALLHGDLWSGNFLCGPDHEAWLIDPAVYFGHPEMEIAFTRLFGGFDPKFYNGYQEVSPLSPNFEERIDLYNLYPLLVHVNLFGTSYLSGIVNALTRYT